MAWSTPGSMVCRQRSANSLHATLQDAVPDHCDLSTSVSAPETTHTDTDAGVVPWLHHQSEAVSPSQAQPPPASASRPPIGPLTTSGPASANQAGRDWRLLWQNSVSILQCSQCSLSLSLSPVVSSSLTTGPQPRTSHTTTSTSTSTILSSSSTRQAGTVSLTVLTVLTASHEGGEGGDV